jgi:peptide/nickel transport system substrate-binding protein
MPAISSHWESNENQTQWTFYIRQNIKFHNDSCFPDGVGRFLVASDVKYCFDKLCLEDPNNIQFSMTFKDRVIGANESYNASKEGKVIGVSGVKVLNDSMLTISLKNPFADFLNILATPGCWIYPYEAVNKYKADFRVHPVGTGPFYLESLNEGQSIILKKNNDYYLVDKFGNRLPYLDGIKYSFISEKKSELLEFKSGNLDMLYRLPIEFSHELMGDLDKAKEHQNEFQILNSPSLYTSYIGFNCNSKLFSKREVRLAFNYAIDRHKIADYTIQGDGSAADFGMVPYNERFKKDGYDFSALKAYKLDVAKAKAYLKKAGYPDGKGFPKLTLEINNGGGDKNILIATVIQKMLKEHLNIDIDINTLPLTEHVERVASGKVDLFAFSWIADYPAPETFLTLFYGKHLPLKMSDNSYINKFRFKNSRFDSLFLASYSISDKFTRYKLLSKAEQIVLNEAPFIPIFYQENFRLEQANVRNFPENALNFMDLTEVYLVPKDRMPKK